MKLSELNKELRKLGLDPSQFANCKQEGFACIWFCDMRYDVAVDKKATTHEVYETFLKGIKDLNFIKVTSIENTTSGR